MFPAFLGISCILAPHPLSLWYLKSYSPLSTASNVVNFLIEKITVNSLNSATVIIISSSTISAKMKCLTELLLLSVTPSLPLYLSLCSLAQGFLSLLKLLLSMSPFSLNPLVTCSPYNTWTLFGTVEYSLTSISSLGFSHFTLPNFPPLSLVIFLN